MNKIKIFLSEAKYELSLFAALSVNFLLFFTKETLMSDGMYPMHLVDVKAGFISRTLVGTINGLLYGNPTKAETAVTHTVVTLLTFWLVAVFLGRCMFVLLNYYYLYYPLITPFSSSFQLSFCLELFSFAHT